MQRSFPTFLLALSLPLLLAPAAMAVEAPWCSLHGLVPDRSQAQSGILPPSPNHPERQWQVIETAHFLVHFYQGHEKLAREVVEVAEASYTQVTNDLGARPKAKVPIILTADSFWNGYAEPLKTRIVLDPLLSKMSQMGLRRFLTHEFTHIITFEAFSAGMPISKVSTAAGVPSWFMEGIAQYEAEYWYPSLDRMLRLHTIERTLLTPGQRNAFHLLGSQAGSAGYNEGFAICKYLFETYGHDKLPRLLAAIKAGKTGFAGAIETVFGKSLTVLEAEWRQHIEERYRKQVAERHEEVAESKPLVSYKKEVANTQPRLSPDGEMLAVMSSRGRSGYVNLRGFLLGRLPLFVGPADGKNAVAVAERVVSYSWSPDSKRLAVTYIGEDRHGNATTKVAIVPIEREKWGTAEARVKAGKVERFDDLDHVGSAAWSPDGQQLALTRETDERSNVVLLDLATKRIARSLTDTQDDRQYGQLAWSPDGQSLVVGTYYPGQGSKLSLLAVADGQERSLTGGNVMVADTHPSWSPDGQAVYFTSDREGFTDLYRLQVADAKVERLTGTYTGVEDPAVTPDGKSILYTRHYNQGTEIRQLPIAPLPARAAAVPQGPPPAKPRPASIQPGDLNVKPYRSTLSPDLVLPLTGRDEKGDQIGIGATFNDILEKHAFSAQVYYGLASNRFSYLVSYDNTMFDPLLRAVAFDVPSLAVSLDGQTPYLQRSQGGALLVGRPIFGNQMVTLGLWGTYQRNVSDLPDSVNPATIVQGFNPHLTLGWGYGAVSGGADADMHPLSGQRLEAGFDVGLPFLGGAFNYSLLSVEGAKYFQIGETDHVLALRGAAGVSFGQASPFLLGGNPITLAVGVQGLTPLRGYSLGGIVGNRLASLTAEYRMPLIKDIDWTFGAIYLDRVYGVAYADVGNAWFDGQPWVPKLGVGGEVRARLGIGGRAPLGVSIGIGKGLIQGPDSPMVYWYLGNTF